VDIYTLGFFVLMNFLLLAAFTQRSSFEHAEFLTIKFETEALQRSNDETDKNAK